MQLSDAFLYHNLHIIRSIQEILTDTTRSLKTILNILPILAARFDRKYKRDPYIDWKEPFRTDVDLFDDLLLGKSLERLALDLAISDRRNMSSQDLISVEELSRLGLKWNFRSEVAQECCVAYPSLCVFLKDLISVSSLCFNLFLAFY